MSRESNWDHMMNTVSVGGQKRPHQAWILTDQDVWVKNPYYHGPAVAHPEDPDPLPECYGKSMGGHKLESATSAEGVRGHKCVNCGTFYLTDMV